LVRNCLNGRVGLSVRGTYDKGGIMANEWRTTGEAVPALQAFDDVMKEYMKQNDISNASLAVTYGTRLVLARGYTWAEPTHETTTPTSLFRLASCTKPLTRVAIYGLSETTTTPLSLATNVQSVLQLTAPDGTALPADAKPADLNTPGHYFGAVTVQHLLEHKGGWNRNLVSEPTLLFDKDVAAAFGKELPITRIELARWGATREMQFYPGSASQYSNFGFALLGLVLERHTGRDFVQHLQQTLFGPLGILRARLTLPLERSRLPGEVAYYPVGASDRDDLTGGGGKVPVQYGGENNANFASFGGLLMSAPDYGRILAAYTDTSPPTITHLRDMLGCPRAIRGGVACSEHGGMLPGSGTYVALRDDDIGLVAFSNKDPLTFTWKGVTRVPDDVLHEVASGIAAADWPAHDLFSTVMTAPLPPGPEKLHIFATGADSNVRDASWERNVGAGWLGWWTMREGRAVSGAPVTAVSRAPDKLDAFVVGTDGGIYTAAWQAGRTVERWRGWWSIQSGKAPTGAMVTAVTRGPSKLDVFVVGNDGGVYTAAWDADVASGQWRGWWRIGNLTAKPGTSVSAVARDPGKLDIFVAGADGKTYTAAWDAAVAGGWRGWWNVLTGALPPGGSVAAVSRNPKQLDIFLVSNDGGIYTAAWEATANKWAGWWRIGNLTANPGAPIAAVARTADKLDIFVAGTDGKTYTSGWDGAVAGGWRSWANILTGAIPPGGAVTAISRNPKQIDLFLVSNDGGVYTSAWEATANKWAGWWRVGDIVAKPGARVGAVSRKLS
jgi:CubicO group peptidase (beta-lactamase class C family)